MKCLLYKYLFPLRSLPGVVINNWVEKRVVLSWHRHHSLVYRRAFTHFSPSIPPASSRTDWPPSLSPAHRSHNGAQLLQDVSCRWRSNWTHAALFTPSRWENKILRHVPATRETIKFRSTRRRVWLHAEHCPLAEGAGTKQEFHFISQYFWLQECRKWRHRLSWCL